MSATRILMAPAVIPDVDRETYDSLDRINWSRLKHLARSPAHYKHVLSAPGEDTDARKLGRAVHMAVLEPERFRDCYILWDGGTRRGKTWEAFAEAHADKEILTEAEWGKCLAVSSAVRADAVAAKYLTNGDSEVTVLWDHEIPDVGGLPSRLMRCKGRLDFVPAAAIVDMKVTRDGSPEGFAREVGRYRHHAQAAYYTDGYEAATGRRLPYVIVSVESTPPHVVTVYRVPEPILELGRKEYRGLLEQLAFCRAENRWPAYAEDELELQLPRWEMGESVDELGLEIGAQSA